MSSGGDSAKAKYLLSSMTEIVKRPLLYLSEKENWSFYFIIYSSGCCFFIHIFILSMNQFNCWLVAILINPSMSCILVVPSTTALLHSS